MILKVIGSNSSGNGYLLIAQDYTLLIECGVHIKKIKQALNFNVTGVGAIVTHSHGDHAGHIESVAGAGINVYALEETFAAKNILHHHRAKVIKPGQVLTVGTFKVKGFSVNHDVPCLGFIIEHAECGRVVFLTDTSFSDYIFPGLNNMIVEANHEVEIMDSNGTPGFLRNRIVGSHMNLKTCKEMILANDLSMVNNVVLIHLSDSNSDAKRFKREIETATGKSVTIAEAGLQIPFNKTAI